MAQILKKDPDIGAQAFNTGLSTGLQQLMNMKMQDLQQRRQKFDKSQAFRSMGIPPELAENLGSLDPKVQQIFLNEMMPKFADNMQQGMGDPAQLLQEFQAYKQQQAQAPQEDELSKSMRALGMFNYNPADQGVRALMGSQSPSSEAQPDQGLEGIMNLMGSLSNGQQQMDRDDVKVDRQPILSQEDPMRGMTRSQRIAYDNRQKELKKEERENRKELVAANNSPSNQKFMDKQSDLNKDAIENDYRLSRMKELISNKDLNRPAFVNLLNTLKKGIFGFGADFKYMLSKDSQEFDKLSKDMLKGAKNIFGSRLTDADIGIFMDMVPTLSLTRDGKNAVIRNIEIFNKGVYARQKAMDDIMAENKGYAPANMKSIVERRIKPELDRLAEEFRSGPAKKPKKDYGVFNPKAVGGVGSIKDVRNALFGKA